MTGYLPPSGLENPETLSRIPLPHSQGELPLRVPSTQPDRVAGCSGRCGVLPGAPIMTKAHAACPSCQSSQPSPHPLWTCPQQVTQGLRDHVSMATCVLGCVISVQGPHGYGSLSLGPPHSASTIEGRIPKHTPRETPACKPPSQRLLEATPMQEGEPARAPGRPCPWLCQQPQGEGPGLGLQRVCQPPAGGRASEEIENWPRLGRAWKEAEACGGAHFPMSRGHLTLEQHGL